MHELSLFLKDPDILHHKTRVMQLGRTGSRSRLHISKESTVISEWDLVVGLPRNLYDNNWLSEHDDEELQFMEVQPEINFPNSGAIVIR